ncbi:MAG: type I methionyl aminopeptidase [Bacteroidales bacterium]|nr:type I methionyl aminopeptidase [Bacteroidales bacterium]
MIYYKTEEEIHFLKLSNQLVSRTHAELVSKIVPGTKTIELDKLAETFIRDNGGVPGFLNYHGYPNTLCISVNDAVVHGIPGKYELNEGDIISIDCGVYMNGFHGDSAFTFAVGEISELKQKLLDTTKASLYKGIEAATSGNRVGDIGYAVQAYAEAAGFSVVRELVGHGVGRNLHEKPEVPNYGRRGRGVKLAEGMTIAIEPMINAGAKEVKQDKDGWTIRTQDGMPSAHFEHSIAIRKGEAELLSDFNVIEEQLKKFR